MRPSQDQAMRGPFYFFKWTMSRFLSVGSKGDYKGEYSYFGD